MARKRQPHLPRHILRPTIFVPDRVTDVHVERLPVAAVPADMGRHHHKRVLRHKVADAAGGGTAGKSLQVEF